MSTGGAESRCPAGPPLVPRRRMEFELLENDVLESLEDLGCVSGGEGAGREQRAAPAGDTALLSEPRRPGRLAPEGRGSGQRLGTVPFRQGRPQSRVGMMSQARRADLLDS